MEKDLELFIQWEERSWDQLTSNIVKKPTQRKWTIIENDAFGRFMEATDDIEEGELIYLDQNVIIGPKHFSRLLCLSCYKALAKTHTYVCRKCQWPLCDVNCELKGLHPIECEALELLPEDQRGIPAALEGKIVFDYRMILPIRLHQIKKMDSFAWAVTSRLKDSYEIKKTENYKQRRPSVTTEGNWLPFGLLKSKEDLDTLAGLLDVNAFEVEGRVGGSADRTRSVRGVYPITALMRHDCSLNCHQVLLKDGSLLALAGTRIKKGEPITGSYTDILDGTIERRRHLQRTKFFDCSCARCSDPTELKTFCSALKCSKRPCDGWQLPLQPLISGTPWQCEKCKEQTPYRMVNQLLEFLEAEEANFDFSNPEVLENLIRRFLKILHPSHYLITRHRHTLSQMYGSLPGFELDKLSNSDLSNKENHCRHLLKLMNELSPGISRLTGVTAFELQNCLRENVSRKESPNVERKEENINKNKTTEEKILQGQLDDNQRSPLMLLKEARGFVDTCIHCLHLEDELSYEGQIVKESRAILEDLNMKISKLEESS